MAMLTDIIERRQISGTYKPSPWFIDWITGGVEASSSVAINEKSALRYTPFWAAVRIIAGTIATLPFLVYRRIEGGGKERMQDHAVYTLLHDRPNEYMDALTFIETRQAHVLTYGNGFAEIQRDGRGRPVALWPLLPDKTQRKVSEAGLPYYEVRLTKGGTVTLPDYNVLHVKGLGFDGYTGYNVVSYHKEALGYGVAVKQYGSRFFTNDATPGGVYEHPGHLGDKALAHLKSSLEAEHAGLKKAHRIQILEEGMKYNKVGTDPQQAQALEVQKYNVDDCSRIFNIPPHKLGSLDRATFSNIEEQNIDFVTSTLYYWMRKWEQECNYKLFMPSERGTYFCEILVEGLLRGNMAARSRAYAMGRQWGWLSINDIREKENMNAIGPAGDVYLDPLNMQPAGMMQGQKIGEQVKRAFYWVLRSQWQRIVTKCVNAGAKSASDGFYAQTRDYANKIIYDPSVAFASLNGATEPQVRRILSEIVDNEIRAGVMLQDEDAGRLAIMTIDRIGDCHALPE